MVDRTLQTQYPTLKVWQTGPQDVKLGKVATDKVKPDGGPAQYYDMPFKDWVTTNDMMEYLASHKWGPEAIHLKDIFKGLCRWGEKSGTDTLYDTKKIIYYGARVMRMLAGEDKTRDYLQKLLDDKQFGGKD